MTYKAKKLASKFHVKDEIKLSNKRHITCAAECPTCVNNKRNVGTYIKSVIEHNAKDIISHLLRHAKHTRVWLDDFKILGSGYNSDLKR